jgi:hypothetical protein
MKKSLLLLFILVVGLQKSFAQTTPFIYTDTVTPLINLAYTEAENDIYINSDETIFPISRTITVPFRTSGTFNTGNVFNIVLSDPSGNFNTPNTRIIGTLSASGNVGNRTVDVVIPYSQLNSQDETLIEDTIPSSFDYRVRVESTNPVIIGSPNATSLTLETSNIMVGIGKEQDENMTSQDMSAVIDWLQRTIVQRETPFCWKRTTTRDVAPAPDNIPSKCNDGYTKSGLFCYENCQSGYYNIAGVCWQSCPSGWVDAGIFCYPSYSTVSTPSLVGNCPSEYDNTGIECYRWFRSDYHPSQLANCPSGYTNMGFTCYRPWSVPIDDFPLSDSRATCPSGYFKGFADRCYYNCGPGWNNDGDFCSRPASSISYANGMFCPTGYEALSDFAFGRCYQRCEEGWHSTLEFCQVDVLSTTKGNYVVPPTLMGCNTGWDYDAGLCYPKCPSGLVGVGPVCWTRCGSMFDCGAACAKDEAVCNETIANQVVSTVMLVISVASTVAGIVGAGKALAYTVNGARKIAKIGGSTAKGTKAFMNLAIKARNVERTTTIWRKAKLAYLKIRPIKNAISKISNVYSFFSKPISIMMASYEMASRDGLVEDFGVDIDNQLKSRFNKTAYNQIAAMWATIKFNKFAPNLGIDIANQALDAVSLAGLADPSGIISGCADVANNFTKPICNNATSFPTLSKNYK